MKIKKRILLVFLSSIICLILAFFIFLPVGEIFGDFNNLILTENEVNTLNSNNVFGKYVKASLSSKEIEVNGVKERKSEIWLKILGFFPIRKASVQIVPAEDVYLGGNAVGFSMQTNGVLVVGENLVNTNYGTFSAISSGKLKQGDIICEIDNKKISSTVDILNVLQETENDILIKGIRKGNNFSTSLKPAKDMYSGNYKLGIWARDDASGIGTITYVKKDGRFGSLGHPITDFETGVSCDTLGGIVHKCAILGVTKGKAGKAGELKGIFMQDEEGLGTIDKNLPVGVYGNISKIDKTIDKNWTAEIAGRLSVVPGKAKIVSTISGIKEEFDIEIIKATKQKVSKSKGIVIRVTDKKLLNLTGGIVQGMSGSPIIQNGKIVGAVTHVFVSDPTKGYGVYLDWMINN